MTRSARQQAIDAGVIHPAPPDQRLALHRVAIPPEVRVLELDEVGREAAARHIRQGPLPAMPSAFDLLLERRRKKKGKRK